MSFYLTHNETNTAKSVYIPVVNYSRQLLNNKLECKYLFDQLTVSLDDLVYINELQAGQIGEVVLVDHNELDDKEKSLNFSDLVTAVVDHHKDIGLFPQASPRIVDLSTGSNASLVMDLIRHSSVEKLVDESFAQMILFPILADTGNLTSRTGPKDLATVEYIKSQYSSIDVNKIFSIICEYKFNQGNDPKETFALFTKDYKQYSDKRGQKYGIAVVNIPIKDWMKLHAPTNKLFTDSKEFMRTNELYFFSILSSFKTPANEFRREMLNISDAATLAKIQVGQGVTFLESGPLFSGNDDLSLVYKFYDVNDLSLTRKHWQPLMDTCLNQ